MSDFWKLIAEHIDLIGKVIGVLSGLSALIYGFYKFLIKPAHNLLKENEQQWEKLNKIYAEITPNGGNSIKDVIKRLEERSIRIENVLIILQNINDALREDGQIGIFECEIDGFNTYVNRTYCKWVGATKDELKGFGWKNYVADFAQNKHYDRDWSKAFEEGREIEFSIALKGINNKVFYCDIHAYPIKGENLKVDRYLGLMYKTGKKENLVNKPVN